MRKFIICSLVAVGISGAVLPLNEVNNNISAAHAATALDCSKQHIDGPYQYPQTHWLKGLSYVTLEGWSGGTSKEFAGVIPPFPSKYATTVTGIMGIAYQTPKTCKPQVLGLVYQALVTEAARSNSWGIVFVLNVPQHLLVAEGRVDADNSNIQAAGRAFLSHIKGHQNDRITSSLKFHK